MSSGLQPGELGVQVDGPQHPVQVEVLRLQEQGAGGGDRRELQFPRQGEGAVQRMTRRELDEERLVRNSA